MDEARTRGRTGTWEHKFRRAPSRKNAALAACVSGLHLGVVASVALFKPEKIPSSLPDIEMRLLYCSKAGFPSLGRRIRDRNLISAIAVSIGYDAAAETELEYDGEGEGGGVGVGT